MSDGEADDVRTDVAPHAPQLPLTLLPITASIPRARRFVSEALPETCWADEITLLVSELASNAVRHAGTPFTVTLGCDGSVVRVEVSDGSAAPPRPRVPPLEAVTGRGLMIVDALASDWGTEPTATGKTGLSVAVALLIGTIELLSVLADEFGLTGQPWDFVSGLDLNIVGYVIVGMFVFTWAVALAVWRFGNIEERWSARLRES